MSSIAMSVGRRWCAFVEQLSLLLMSTFAPRGERFRFTQRKADVSRSPVGTLAYVQRGSARLCDQ